MLWAGSDDGLVHVSRDGGETWSNVTPPGPARVGADQLDRALAARRRHRLRGRHPLQARRLRALPLRHDRDYGKTWRRTRDGIPDDDFTRVIREDPVRPGLLYAGTETGVYVSFDDGAPLAAAAVPDPSEERG